MYYSYLAGRARRVTPNFMCFGDAGQYIPLAELTLLFGPNSAGKSAVVRAVNLLREVVYPDGKESNGGRSRFADCVHQGDTSREIVIGFLHCGPQQRLDTEAVQRTPYPCFQLHQCRESPGIAMRGIEVRVGTAVVARIESKPDGQLRLMRLDANDAVLSRYWTASEVALDDDSTPQAAVVSAEDVRTFNRNIRKHHLVDGGDRGFSFAARREHLQGLGTAAARAIPAFLKKISWHLTSPKWQLQSNFQHLPAIRKVLSPEEQASLQSSGARWGTEAFAWRAIMGELSGSQELRDRVNYWLGKNGVDLPYLVEHVSVDTSQRATSGERIVLRDIRVPGNVRSKLGLTDVGTGVSQVIPVISACCLHNEQWTVIEHPELHLHPRAQCALADVFIQQYQHRVLGRYSNNSFLLETHSEHFLLRLLRRIREANRSVDEQNSISPE